MPVKLAEAVKPTTKIEVPPSQQSLEEPLSKTNKLIKDKTENQPIPRIPVSPEREKIQLKSRSAPKLTPEAYQYAECAVMFNYNFTIEVVLQDLYTYFYYVSLFELGSYFFNALFMIARP